MRRMAAALSLKLNEEDTVSLAVRRCEVDEVYSSSVFFWQIQIARRGFMQLWLPVRLETFQLKAKVASYA